MHLRRVSRLSLLLLMGGAAYAGVPVPPSSPLGTALQRGDAAAVHRIEQKGSAGRITKNMDRAQLRYDIPQLLSAAHKCESAARGGGTHGDLAAASRCSYIARSSALVLGNAREFLHEAQWAKSILYPALAKAFGHVTTFGNGLDKANLPKLIRSTPAPSESWLRGSMKMAFRNPRAVLTQHTEPIIEIAVNGHAVPATIQVNKGVPLRTPIALVEPVDSKTPSTSQLGLTPLIRYYATTTVTYLSVTHRQKPALFLADTVTVGPLLMHHLAVGVIKSDYLPPGIYMGSAMWRRFGEVVINGTGIRLLQHAAHDCRQSLRLTFASNYHEDGSQLFPIRLDGVQRIAVFVTGNPNLVTIATRSGSHDAPSQNGSDDTALQRAAAKGRAKLQIGQQAIQVAPVNAKSDSDEPYQVSLGMPILDRYTVHLRLSGGSPSICFATSATGSGSAAGGHDASR